MEPENTPRALTTEESDARVDEAVRSLTQHLADAMRDFRVVVALEPNMQLTSFEELLESLGAEVAARWRFHQETGSW